jgi:LAO/AO transport system kinase
VNELVERLRSQRLALTRTISLVENGGNGAANVLRQITAATGHARVLGITGPPGAGKSTLTNQLIHFYRGQDKQVAVVAVDPSSSISGGAVLGDRIRMQEFYGDERVYIRSMASRGQVGGLSAATNDTVRVLDAAGFDVIIIETVGAGQDEVSIARAAQTTILVEVPGLGDDVQSIKAGILEIADVLVVNKGDREGADKLITYLKTMLNLGGKYDWKPPVVKTVALEGKGIVELAEKIDEHYAYLEKSGKLTERTRAALHDELIERVKLELANRIAAQLNTDAGGQMLDELVARELDVATAARRLVEGLR